MQTQYPTLTRLLWGNEKTAGQINDAFMRKLLSFTEKGGRVGSIASSLPELGFRVGELAGHPLVGQAYPIWLDPMKNAMYYAGVGLKGLPSLSSYDKMRRALIENAKIPVLHKTSALSMESSPFFRLGQMSRLPEIYRDTLR